MKYSTGRGTRVRHSTAREWDELEEEKKRSGYQELKHSTGEKPAIKHATGVQFDYRASIEKSGKSKGVCSKVHSKPILSGEEYLELYYEFLEKKSQENMKNAEHKKETEKRETEKIINKPVKKMIIEY
ncbi:MAG: hypothetical protein AB1348_01970 [Nitrospirota bacterium]